MNLSHVKMVGHVCQTIPSVTSASALLVLMGRPAKMTLTNAFLCHVRMEELVSRLNLPTFQCHCAEGYGGQLCELDENESECLSADVCSAGLVCINDELGFRCLPKDQVGGGSQVGGGNGKNC